MYLCQITVLLQQNTTASLLELYFNDSMQTLYARGGGGGSQQREVADGADVVFTDTGVRTRMNKISSFFCHTRKYSAHACNKVMQTYRM